MKVIEKEIAMIAYFFKNGNIKPVRFQIITEEQEEKVIDIKNIQYQTKERIGGKEYLIFTCTVDLNECEKICEIRFCKENCKWVLYKI